MRTGAFNRLLREADVRRDEPSDPFNAWIQYERRFRKADGKRDVRADAVAFAVCPGADAARHVAGENARAGAVGNINEAGVFAARRAFRPDAHERVDDPGMPVELEAVMGRRMDGDARFLRRLKAFVGGSVGGGQARRRDRSARRLRRV